VWALQTARTSRRSLRALNWHKYDNGWRFVPLRASQGRRDRVALNIETLSASPAASSGLEVLPRAVS
jgi:hypothetical protein